MSTSTYYLDRDEQGCPDCGGPIDEQLDPPRCRMCGARLDGENA